jgi:hypothetical protein
MARLSSAGRSMSPVPQQAASSRSMARSVPDHAKASGDAIGKHKSLAYAAWKSARLTQPIPAVWLDRIWADCLSATSIAPPEAGARMYRRAETAFRLLVDMQRWPRG